MNPNDLTGLTVSSTYGRIVQVIDGRYYDGFGNLLNIGSNLLPVLDGGTPNTNSTSGVFKIDFGGIV